MKNNVFNILSILLLAIITFSCTKEVETTTSSTSSTTSTTSSDTWVKLTIIDVNGDVKPNYEVFMFESEPSKTSPLPPIIKEVTTDANGLAYFDLSSLVTSTNSKTYYFEAFYDNGTGYIWESITHYNVTISKGQMVTSSILVD